MVMEKKKESKNGIEIMNLLQVQCYTLPEIVKMGFDDYSCSGSCDLLL